MKNLCLVIFFVFQTNIFGMLSTTQLENSTSEDDDQELAHVINPLFQENTIKNSDYILEKLGTIYYYKNDILTQKIDGNTLQQLYDQLQTDWESLGSSEKSNPVLIPFYLINEHSEQDKYIERDYPPCIRSICKMQIDMIDMQNAYLKAHKDLRKNYKKIENKRAEIIKKLAELERETRETKIQEIKNKIEYQTLCGYALYIKQFTDNYHEKIKGKILHIEQYTKNLATKTDENSIHDKIEQEKLLFDIKQDYNKLNNALNSKKDSYKGIIEKTTGYYLAKKISSLLLNEDDIETAETRINFEAGWAAHCAQYWNKHQIQFKDI